MYKAEFISVYLAFIRVGGGIVSGCAQELNSDLVLRDYYWQSSPPGHIAGH